MTGSRTPLEIELMKAITARNTGDVKLLFGANPGLDRQMALMHAVANAGLQMINFIIGLGADPLRADEEGHTPAMKASWQGKEDELRLFLDLGADINQKDKRGYTVLMSVAENGSEDGKYWRYLGALNLLLARNASLAERNARGKTALDLAEAKDKDGIIADTLRAAAIAVRKTDMKGQKVDLWGAVLRSDVAEIPRLIALDADPNEKIGDDSIMGVAVQTWSVDVVRALVEGGTDIELKDAAGNAGLSHACMHAAGADIVEYLLGAGANVNAVNKHGVTPLMRAAGNGLSASALLLLGNGADINAQDDGGMTPLMAAALSGRKETALLLLDHGATLSLRDDKGRTAHEIAEEKYPDLAAAMREKEASLEAKAEEARNLAQHKTALARQQQMRRLARRAGQFRPGGLS